MAVQWHTMAHGCAWGCGLLGGCSCGSGISYEAPCLHSQPGRRPRFLPPGMLLSVPAYSHMAEILGCSDAFPFCPRLRHWFAWPKAFAFAFLMDSPFGGFRLAVAPFWSFLVVPIFSDSILSGIPPIFIHFWDVSPVFRIHLFRGSPSRFLNSPSRNTFFCDGSMGGLCALLWYVVSNAFHVGSCA